MIKSFIIFLFTVFIIQSGYSQRTEKETPKEKKSFWLATSFGYSSLGSLSAALNGNIEIGDHYLVTGQVQTEFQDLVILGTQRPSTKYINTYSLLLGKSFIQKSSLFSISSGLSRVNVDAVKGTYSTPSTPVFNKNTIGIPVVFQGYFILGRGILVASRIMGIGLSAYLNLNSIQTTAGIGLNIGLGRFIIKK